jgi:dTDP-4-dehydrorhamnose reductase
MRPGGDAAARFALEIFNRAKSNGISLAIENVQGISSHEYPTPAKRPLNSRMSCEKFHSTFGFSLPSWQKGLEDCYLERVHRL